MKDKPKRNKISMLILFSMILSSTINLYSTPTSLLFAGIPVLIVETVNSKTALKKEKKLIRKTEKLEKKLKKLKNRKKPGKGKTILIIGIAFLLLGLLLFFTARGIDGCLQLFFGIAVFVGGVVMVIIGAILGNS